MVIEALKATVREKVYQAIDAEREYQDSKSPYKRIKDRSLGDYIILIDAYIAYAKNSMVKGNCKQAKHEIRKIAALAVHCMEEHGIEPR